MDILNGLNDVQRKALESVDGAVLVTAGAGSGKTKLLTHTIASLVLNKNVCDENIVAITFTNKAAKEMKSRVDVLLGRRNNILMSTFHSLCLRILRENIFRLEGYSSNFSIYDEKDKEKALKDILKQKKITDKEVNYFDSIFSYCSNNNIDIYKHIVQSASLKGNQEDIIYVYESYENLLKKNNALDFDHLISKVYELFVCFPDVREYYSNLFVYVFVDEFQDTNVIQYELVKMLCAKHGNIFAVGDEDQCIYTWRGANFENTFNFPKDFKGTKVFKLEQNYRSTKKIIEKANKLINNNTERLKKVLFTDNDEGKDVDYTDYNDDRTEADNVASKINLLVKNGYKYSDIAILMRMNALSFPFEQKLLAYNIPHRIYGGFKFYERVEIKTILSYLKMFVNPNDDISLLKIINVPKRAIGDAAIAKIREIALQNNLSLIDACGFIVNQQYDKALASKLTAFVANYEELVEKQKTASLFDFANDVVNKFGLKDMFNPLNEEEHNKLLNIDEFLNSVAGYESSNEGATLLQYLESVTLESDIDTLGDGDNVTISTVHSVKGLEFDVVFVVGLEEGIFPSFRSIENPSKMEEERRLMYVAMTRAKKRLFVSCVKQRFLHGKVSYMQKSRFLGEAELVKKYSFKQEQTEKVSYTDFASMQKNATIKVEPKIVFTKIDTSKYSVGQTVLHPKFGKGIMQKITDGGVCGEINFEGFGVKTLLLEIAPLTIV